jgi:hypothetical protein
VAPTVDPSGRVTVIPSSRWRVCVMGGGDDPRAPEDPAGGDAPARVNGDDREAGALHRAGEIVGKGLEDAGG